MNNICSIGFHGGGSECAGSAARRVQDNARIRVNNQPEGDTVNFRGNEYPYYNAESKKKSPLLAIGISLLSVAAAIGGLAYAHKSGSVAKMKDGAFRDKFAEPVTNKCHEWCSWAKKNGTDLWNKVFKKGN